MANMGVGNFASLDKVTKYCHLCETTKTLGEFPSSPGFCYTCEFAIRMREEDREKIKRMAGPVEQTPSRRRFIRMVKQGRGIAWR